MMLLTSENRAKNDTAYVKDYCALKSPLPSEHECVRQGKSLHVFFISTCSKGSCLCNFNGW